MGSRDTTPRCVRWRRSRVGGLFMMIFVEVRPASDIRVELPRTKDAKPSDLQPRQGDSMTCSGTVRAGASEPALAHQRQQDVDIVQSEFPSNSEQTSPLFVCNASLL